MSEKTKIQWCDSTINFWSGCTKVSDGCKHCYAEARDKRHMIEKVDHWGKGAPRLKSKSAIKDAFKLNGQPWICDACGMAHAVLGQICMTPGCDCETRHRRRIFSLSLGDWLDAEVPIAWLAEMLDTIRQCDQVVWILCTKRPEWFSGRMLLAWAAAEPNPELANWIKAWAEGTPPKHIWLLTSVENQKAADERIPELLKIPAAVLGLSLEPLLGPVNLVSKSIQRGSHYKTIVGTDWLEAGRISWLIPGGESGPGARACNVSWIYSLLTQGEAAGVPVLVKQLGSNCVTDNANLHDWPDDAELIGQSEGFAAARVKFKNTKGGDWNEWPEELRVRQFPAEARPASL